jgi:hypothetical protein
VQRRERDRRRPALQLRPPACSRAETKSVTPQQIDGTQVVTAIEREGRYLWDWSRRRTA